MLGDVMLQATWGDPLAAQLGGGDARIRGSDPASHLRHITSGPGAVVTLGSTERLNTARATPGLADMPVGVSEPVATTTGDARAQANTPWWLDIFRAPYLDPESGEITNPSRQGAQEGAQAAVEALAGPQAGTRLMWGAIGALLLAVGFVALVLPAGQTLVKEAAK